MTSTLKPFYAPMAEYFRKFLSLAHEELGQGSKIVTRDPYFEAQIRGAESVNS